MGLFSRNFDRPGPGVPKDMPRKKGLARFLELFFRDTADLIKLNLLFCLCILPSAVLFLLGALPFVLGENEINIIFVLLSLMLAFPIGGAITACYFNITRLMRDDPSYVWFDFKRKFKENYKQAALAGIICTAFIYMHILMWIRLYYQLITETYTDGLLGIVLMIISILVFMMITPYIFMHFAYINMTALQTLKNSLMMTMAYLPRSFMGAVCGTMIWAVLMLFMPDSLIVLPAILLLFVSLSMLLHLSWIWPPFEKNFKIEETLIQRKETSMEASEKDETNQSAP